MQEEMFNQNCFQLKIWEIPLNLRHCEYFEVAILYFSNVIKMMPKQNHSNGEFFISVCARLDLKGIFCQLELGSTVNPFSKQHGNWAIRWLYPPSK